MSRTGTRRTCAGQVRHHTHTHAHTVLLTQVHEGSGLRPDFPGGQAASRLLPSSSSMLKLSSEPGSLIAFSWRRWG